MSDERAEEKISDLVKESIGWDGGGLLAVCPIDISRPNFHESKSEFVCELRAVESLYDNTKQILSTFLSEEASADPNRLKMVERIADFVEKAAQPALRKRGIQSASDLAISNLYRTGFFWGSLSIIKDLHAIYEQRLLELLDQEKEFWSVNHRPPNHYARAIALRFARYYARQTQHKPTFGISSEGPHPSTEYGRLLEEIFSILEIKTNVRNPAEWAIDQLENKDLKPQSSPFLYGLAGKPPSGY